jgi:hypothetical protein
MEKIFFGKKQERKKLKDTVPAWTWKKNFLKIIFFCEIVEERK